MLYNLKTYKQKVTEKVANNSNIIDVYDSTRYPEK